MELVPDIAYGNLATSSLAEVIAAAFRANATGTIAVEQGKGESRVYVQYGSPCGTALLTPVRSFGDYLIEAGALTKEQIAPLARKAEQRKQNLSSLLQEEQTLGSDQVLSFLAAYHHEELVALCLVREGKYELRGWERPPDWTESIHLDPLRAIITALSADELADRRQAIVALIGDRQLGVSNDFEDLAGRLYVDDADVRSIQLLRTPMTVTQYLEALGGTSSEAAVAAYAMLGLIDESSDQPEFAPSAPIHIDDHEAFPVMVEELEAPASAPNRRTSPPPLAEEDAIDVQFDVEPVTNPGPSAAHIEESALFDDEAVGSWSNEMSSRLDEALQPAEGDGFATIPGAISMSQPESFSARDAHTEPVSTLHANESRGLLGQLEFEAPESMDDLELDFARAPKEILRDSLDRDSRFRSPRSRAPGSTDPMMGKVRVGSLGSTDPSISGAAPARTIIGRNSARPGQTRAKSTRDEYNPFRPHFRKRPSAVASAVGADPLDDALEQALRGPRSAVVSEPAPPRHSRPSRTAAPPQEPAPQTIAARPSRMVSSPSDAIDAAIEDSFSAPDLQADSQAEVSAAIDIPVEPVNRVGEGDGLALDLARSEAMEEEEDVSSFVGDEDDPIDPPTMVASAEVSARQAAARNSMPPNRPPDDASREAGSEVRRRLLQRAMRNVSGPFQTRDSSVEVVRPTSDPFAKPAASSEPVDAEIEKDLDDRAAKAAKGDFFATLDLERNAGTDQVKAAFLVLAKKYHPDRLSSVGQTNLLPKARDVFAQVKDAYDALLDPATRARHLNELEAKAGGRKMTRDDAKGAYQRALVFLKRKDWKQAEAELVRAIDSDPAPDYLAEMAWTLLSNPARRDDAKDEIKSLVARALTGSNLSDRVFVVAAHIARLDGDLTRMEKFFRSAMEKNPKNVEAARELRLIELRKPAEKPSGLLDRFRKKS